MSARDLPIFPHEANINTAMIVLYLCAGIFQMCSLRLLKRHVSIHIAVFFCVTLSLEEFIQNRFSSR